MSEALLALKEARETLNRLLAKYPNTGITTRRFELNKDLKHIQDQITDNVENFLDQVFYSRRIRKPGDIKMIDSR